ncbi:type III secretion system cytoplasmic ring protein SctQ [Ralstonia solanacearum]|uniref:YscQ/HrcQ family type III secretion apparatus protein n=1 Tax=Ralstonia solanacearum TaxID=305 RepID=A0AAD0SBE5_RALSL|nr:YscQ/HrcQ family type III secretion apparatus protein [Ralstonia solanacearum]AXW55027.1 YscQ/HrcQ family type III secretion apparatus protein [Ralstonia solanacearum]CBJ35153.1 type III secretion system apparatus protein HrcQ [Ralstonia solanacearum PSI07]
MNAGPSFSALEPHLRAFTPAHAALTRLLDGVHRGGESDDWQLQLARTPVAASAPITLSIQSAQCHAELIIDGAHYPALHAIARETDRPRRLALGNLWLAPVLQALEDAGLSDAQLTNLRRLKADAVDTAGPVLPLQIASAVHTCRCDIRALNWQGLPPAPPAADPDTILHRFSGLALPGRLRVASRRCRRDTLDTLAPGDILLGWNDATYRPATDEGTVCLAWGDARQPHLTATAHYKDGIVTTLDLPPLTDDDDAFQDDFATAPRMPAGNSADSSVPLEQLEVPVHLELAVMGMPLSELAALQPQHVLTLPVKIRDATVRLVCHGQTLGHGQLVAVGEQLGLQIASIGKHHAER